MNIWQIAEYVCIALIFTPVLGLLVFVIFYPLFQEKLDRRMMRKMREQQEDNRHFGGC